MRTSAALALVWALTPLTAHADPTSTAGVTNSTVCQVSVTIVTGMPVSMSVTVPPPLQVTFSVDGSGTCSGLTPGPFRLSQGSGATAGPVTCADFVGSGSALLGVGTNSFVVQFDVAGPTAAGQWVVSTSSISLGGSYGAGVMDLALSTASLQACAQSGGTSTLTYTGVAAFVF